MPLLGPGVPVLECDVTAAAPCDVTASLLRLIHTGARRSPLLDAGEMTDESLLARSLLQFESGDLFRQDPILHQSSRSTGVVRSESRRIAVLY